MSSADRKFPRERRLTKAESAALAREVLDRARQALRDGAPVRATPEALALPPPGLDRRPFASAMRRRARTVRLTVLRAARGLYRSPNFQPGLIGLCLMVTATGAMLHQSFGP